MEISGTLSSLELVRRSSAMIMIGSGTETSTPRFVELSLINAREAVSAGQIEV